MKILLFICSLILLTSIISINKTCAKDIYQVNTQTILNVRSGPGTNFRVISTLYSGSTIKVDSFHGDWAKIIINDGKIGYIYKKYINQVNISESSTSFFGSKNNIELLYACLIIFIIIYIINIFDWGNGILTLLLFIILPILLIVYIKTTDNPMWFCSPQRVGWILTILNVFLVFMAVALLGGLTKLFFFETWNSFRYEKDIITGFINLILLALVGYTTFLVICTALMELLIVGIIMIIGSASGGSSYMGEFTDKNGNIWEVWKN